MVKFEFVLDDEAAENLINCIQEQIAKLAFDKFLQEDINSKDINYFKWVDARIKYMREIKEVVCSGSSRI